MRLNFAPGSQDSERSCCGREEEWLSLHLGSWVVAGEVGADGSPWRRRRDRRAPAGGDRLLLPRKWGFPGDQDYAFLDLHLAGSPGSLREEQGGFPWDVKGCAPGFAGGLVAQLMRILRSKSLFFSYCEIGAVPASGDAAAL